MMVLPDFLRLTTFSVFLLLTACEAPPDGSNAESDTTADFAPVLGIWHTRDVEVAYSDCGPDHEGTTYFGRAIYLDEGEQPDQFSISPVFPEDLNCTVDDQDFLCDTTIQKAAGYIIENTWSGTFDSASSGTYQEHLHFECFLESGCPSPSCEAEHNASFTLYREW